VNSGLSLNWRLIINLGAASVYETSLLFHRNYSIPYIPGSAVKGVTRHWAIQRFAEEVQKLKNISYEEAVKEVDAALENGKDLGIKLDDGIKFKELIDIFGTQNQKGRIIFFDALPIIERNKDFVVLDVMNVHYRDYYQDEKGGIPPGDWMNPNPIFFLAVEKGTKFRFALASRNEELVEKAKTLLKEALENLGIGAKTSAGYGYFEMV
jgi:CRISPR-associated protein Cmr6